MRGVVPTAAGAVEAGWVAGFIIVCARLFWADSSTAKTLMTGANIFCPSVGLRSLTSATLPRAASIAGHIGLKKTYENFKFLRCFSKLVFPEEKSVPNRKEKNRQATRLFFVQHAIHAVFTGWYPCLYP